LALIKGFWDDFMNGFMNERSFELYEQILFLYVEEPARCKFAPAPKVICSIPSALSVGGTKNVIG
jgi:hypothetical protein